MSSFFRRRGRGPDRRATNPPTTADATPTLASALRGVAAGPPLDELVARSLGRLGHPLPAAGLSTTWEGASRVCQAMTALGCYLETQVHADRCLCRVLRVLQGNAVSKQLSSADAGQLPEAVARAALLACLEMEPPGA
jgi:hypothetical protein